MTYIEHYNGIDAYTLAYIQHLAGQRPWPKPSQFNIPAHEASLARGRANTTLRKYTAKSTKATRKLLAA